MAAPDRRRFRVRPLTVAVTAGCVGGLGWLCATQYGQLGKAITSIGHARMWLVVAAVGCEWVSLAAFARTQRRMLKVGGLRLGIASALGIAFAGDALALSVPVVGSGLGTAFTYRQFRRHHASDAAAALALLGSGVLETLSLMAIIAAGTLASGDVVAGTFGALWAAGCVVGVAGLVLWLRAGAGRRLVERIAVVAVRITQRLRRSAVQAPDAVVASALRQLEGVRFRRIDWTVGAGMAGLNWAGDAACLTLSLAAARLGLPLHDVLLVWSAGVGAGSVYLTPGGIGVVDVTLVAALAGLGVPAAAGVVGVLIYRLISLWLVLLTGWISFLCIGLRRPHPDPVNEQA